MARSKTKGSALRYAIAERLDERDIALVLRRALAGGREAPETQKDAHSVLWEDGGDQALVHVDSVIVRLLKQFIVASVDLETEQTGRAPLIVTIALGSTQDGAGLIGATDEQLRGHPVLSARWGAILRQTIWAALLDTARRFASERGKVPTAIHVLEGHLRIDAEPAVDLRATAVDAFHRAFPQERNRKLPDR